MKQLFLFFLMLLPVVTIAETIEIDGIYYKLNNNQYGNWACVTKNPNKYVGSVVIPESLTYDGTEYTVNQIDVDAFRSCDGLTSVKMPNTITSISNYAFGNVVV